MDERPSRACRLSVFICAVVMAAGTLTAAAAPAGAKLEKCEPLAPRAIKGHDRAYEKLAGGRVVPVAASTEDEASVNRYQSGVWLAALPPLVTEWDYRQLRVQPSRAGRLHVLVEWKETTTFPIDQTDIDLRALEMGKKLIASSMVYNPFPEPLRTAAKAGSTPIGDGTGGPGWEYVEFEARACVGYLIESYTWSSEEAEDISVKVWLSGKS